MSTVHALPFPAAACPLAREKALADAIRPLADELMLVDPSELIGLCRAEKHANINDLVESAAELLFRPDTLRYGGAAEVELHWDSFPRIVLDMEFEQGQVLILFRLRIGAGGPGVDVCHARFADFDGPPAAATQLVVSALENARFAPVRRF